MTRTILDEASGIVHDVTNRPPASNCMLVAAAIAGLTGRKMTDIRIGSLFWPESVKNDAYLSMRGGWGCEGFNPAEGRIWLSDPVVSNDGEFQGHAWLATQSGVIDLMHDYEGPEIARDAKWFVAIRYIRRPPLERAVKAFWRKEMRQCLARGKEIRTADLASAATSPEIRAFYKLEPA